MTKAPFITVLTAALCCGSASSQPPAEQTTKWVTQTFQIQPNFPWWKWWHQINEQYPSIDSAEMPPLPSPAAAKEEWIKQIKTTTAAARKSVEDMGDPFPQGTAFLYDEQSGTLVTRVTKDHLPNIELLVRRINHPVQRTVSLQLHVLEGPASEIQQLVTRCKTKEDHSGNLAKALEAAKSGEWRIVAQSANEVRSGQRLAMEVGAEWKASFTGEIDASGQAFFEASKQPAGLLLEADPILSPGNTIVEINCALEYHFAPPRHRFEKVRHLSLPTDLPVQLPLVDTHFSKVVTSTSFRASQSRLLTVWTPTDQNGTPRKGIMQVAFLTPHVILAFPPLNEGLRDIFLAHVDQAEPISNTSTIKEPQVIPQGMEIRSFKVPHDFPSDEQDPFSPTPSPAKRPDAVKAKKLLEAAGITFPEGSRVYHSSYFTLLTAINTPDNLDAIEAYSTALTCRWPKRELLFTSEIIQADAALLRPILATCTASGDHQKGRLAIESLLQTGQAQQIESHNLPVRSGQRAVFESGQLVMQPAQVTLKEPTPAPAKKDPTQPEVTKTDHLARSEISHETQLSGTRIEIDPVLSPNWRTIDLNLAFEYHYAPPEFASTNENQPSEQPIRFHRFRLETSTVVPQKVSRILGVWKPEGSPEFEGKNLLQVAFFRMDLRLVEHDF